MHKILIEVKRNTLFFSLYTSKEKVERLNDTNIINTEKMVFSDIYINDNIDLVSSFLNLISIKKNINTISISINSLFPFIFRLINNNTSIKNIILQEDKVISYLIFDNLLNSKYIESVDCYSIPSFMLDKLSIDKNITIKSRCEVLFLSNFMEENNFNTYSDIYYKKIIDINCNLEEIDKDDIISFIKFNNSLKVINLYNIKETSIVFILDLLKENNKKHIKIVLNQKDEEKNIIKISERISNKYKKLLKSNNIKIKINYTKEYKNKNMMKQVNLTFFRLILIIFIIIAIAAIVVFKIKYEEDTDSINDELDEINDVIDLNEIDNYIEEEVEIEEEEEETSESSSYVSPYYYNFEQVFSKLLEINDETVGWLKVNNTNINYPVTQHSDNDYYLNYSYYKQKNSYGWIFMDYRNSIDSLDKNTIIYGHRNNAGIMFGTLKNVLEKSWYTNKNNQVITFNTLNANMKWQIFSIYTLKNTNDYLSVTFSSDDSYAAFIDKITKRSIYDFKVDVSTDDNILTLSTCYNNSEYRLVVHAKLIK